jgi:hypothetical protein
MFRLSNYFQIIKRQQKNTADRGFMTYFPRRADFVREANRAPGAGAARGQGRNNLWIKFGERC